MKTPKTHTTSVRKAAGKTRLFYNGLVNRRFSLKEQVFFAKRLAYLINAGMPLLEALTVLHEQTGKRGHAKILEHVIRDVSNGQSLSRSLARYPGVFGEFAIHIIKIGESTGTLSQNLIYLADELRKRQALKRKIIGAFIYPALITVATLGITAFLMLYLFPKIMPIFESLNAQLPLSTKIVMAVSVFFQQWGLLFIIATALTLLVMIIVLKKSFSIRRFFESLYLKIPVIGTVMRFYNVANGSRTLGLLLKSGVRLSEALPITADTTKNLLYKRHYLLLAAVVDRGERMSSHMRANRGQFPEILSHMVSVGERSGSLSDTLIYLSEMYETEVDDFTKNLSTLIEPILMIFMGVLVGFIAISIITPIYGITQNLHN